MAHRKPKVMITYRCRACGEESSVADTYDAKCFYCDLTGELIEIKREKITPELIAEKIRSLSDRMMSNLKQAYAVGQKQGFAEGEEDQGLAALAKAKEFQLGVGRLADDIERKRNK